MTDDEAGLEARLFVFVRERGYPVAGDGSTNESGAAACLGYASRSTLAKQHACGKLRLRFRMAGRSRWYAIADIARYLSDWRNG
ncbi:hypothetical protein BJG93_02200 [Paraburkholderia sprentiae WSM5005]|uniref:DNA-binding protein n=1 Tax=Paraburkholderia sprentiae WSM5005 TaxID=754502 RepID=A0A1I9YDF3_9BURK|nr:hypothetical protein [Paraburkholderia sprentiae]APA84336.1 hypothetical protein BJG93_02200 [Paraburkholderia sprentiae WSM5005]